MASKATDNTGVKCVLTEEFHKGVECGAEPSTGVKSAIPEPSTGIKSAIPEPSTGVKSAIPEPSTGIKSAIPEQSTGVKSAIPEPSTGIKSGIPEPSTGIKSGIPEPSTGVKSGITEPSTGVKSDTTEPRVGVRLSKRAKREQRWEKSKARQLERRREEQQRRNRNKREAGVKKRRTLMSDVTASKISVAIDCSFNQLMNEREREGLAKQIKYCYASNRSSLSPLQLHVCGYSKGVNENLARSSPEHPSWDIHRHNGDITEVFPTNQITYLTADSPNLITELSNDRCYVIGGLLDHNRHKGACLDKAERMGLTHGRLGLGEVVELAGRAVLAINHVFDILLRYSSCRDWSEAIISCLPPRKISCIKKSAQQSDSEGEAQTD